MTSALNWLLTHGTGIALAAFVVAVPVYYAIDSGAIKRLRNPNQDFDQ